jgi:chorismate synthase
MHHTFIRPSNHAGGLEGGITNGQPVIVRAAMKPIPTLARPLPSVDLASKQAFDAQKERTDACAVPAAAVVAEAAVAFVLADALLEKTGGDSLEEVLRNLKAYRDALDRY